MNYQKCKYTLKRCHPWPESSGDRFGAAAVSPSPAWLRKQTHTCTTPSTFHNMGNNFRFSNFQKWSLCVLGASMIHASFCGLAPAGSWQLLILHRRWSIKRIQVDMNKGLSPGQIGADAIAAVSASCPWPVWLCKHKRHTTTTLLAW